MVTHFKFFDMGLLSLRMDIINGHLTKGNYAKMQDLVEHTLLCLTALPSNIPSEEKDEIMDALLMMSLLISCDVKGTLHEFVATIEENINRGVWKSKADKIEHVMARRLRMGGRENCGDLNKLPDGVLFHINNVLLQKAK